MFTKERVIDKLPDGVYKFTGKQLGPTIAVFAGIHGDERAGILALQELLPTIKVTKGILYIVLANQTAIEKNVRQVNKNLNRLFHKGLKGNSYEDKRARELMAILDKCDGLLDLHQYKYTVGEPFAICENRSLKIADIFDVGIISTNWAKAEPGATDGYMYEQGKIGICLECGSISRAEYYKDMTIKSVKQFLKYFGMTNEQVSFSLSKKRIIKAKRAVVKTSDDFKMDLTIQNFQELKTGQVIGSQAGKVYKAGVGEWLIFPDPDASKGAEVWIIGEEQK